MARKKLDGPVLPSVLSIRGTSEWKQWLDGLADKNRAGIAVTLDQALADLADKLKYRKPPPRIQ